MSSNHRHLVIENRLLSDRYRIGTNTGCIVSNRRLLLYRPILCASLQVQQLLTGRITQDDQRAVVAVTRRTRYLIHDRDMAEG